MRAERRAVLLIVASRALSEAVAFAAVASILHSMTVGQGPIPMLAATAALFGATLVLTAVLRERGSVRQSAGLTGVVIVGFVAWGLMQPARGADVLAVLTRIISFGILAEAYLWRALSIARGLQRWREVRNDALFALGAIALASLVAGPIDRDALPALGLTVACAGAVALSLARSNEELALSAGQIHGRTASASATGTAFALGVLALVVAFALPWLQATVASIARVVGPLLGDILFMLLLPLGYVAAYLVYLVQWLRELIKPTGMRLDLPRTPFDPDADAQRLRELEQARPFVFGAVEVFIAIVALLIAGALILRLVQERRASLPEGVSLDRERVDGIGLRATLRGLFPSGGSRARPPVDDGTPGAALRRLYWRLLELAEREGPGWRAPAETPAEHERRLIGSAERWGSASSVVRAFESLRYGEREPDRETVDRAREALRRAEAPR